MAALQVHGTPVPVMCVTAIGGLLKSGLWNQHRKKDGISTDLRGCRYLLQTTCMEPLSCLKEPLFTVNSDMCSPSRTSPNNHHAPFP